MDPSVPDSNEMVTREVQEEDRKIGLDWIGLELSCLVIKIFDHSASRYQLHPMLQLTTKQGPNHSDQN